MTQVTPDGRGLFSKYRVEHPDGRVVSESHFILRPGRDPHADAARLADPSFVDGLVGRYIVRKFLRWDGEEGPAGTPVYGDPILGAVPLPLGAESDANPGDDMAGLFFGDGPEVRVARVLRAYADDCECYNPVLARDLRRAAASGSGEDGAGEGCLCDFRGGCGGLRVVTCRGCGGDCCVCTCGGESECAGCEDCDFGDDLHNADDGERDGEG